MERQVGNSEMGWPGSRSCSLEGVAISCVVACKSATTVTPIKKSESLWSSLVKYLHNDFIFNRFLKGFYVCTGLFWNSRVIIHTTHMNIIQVMLDGRFIDLGVSAKYATSPSIGHQLYTQVIPILAMRCLYQSLQVIQWIFLFASEHDISRYRLLIEFISVFMSSEKYYSRD
jgi:hypothetical protein